MVADQTLKIMVLNQIGIKTAHIETRIVRLQRPIRTKDVTIHAGKNPAAGNVQPLTDVSGVVDVAPEFSGPAVQALRFAFDKPLHVVPLARHQRPSGAS